MKTGTGVVDAALPWRGFDFEGASRWHVLVLDRGVPVAQVAMPSPGRVSGESLARATLIRRADEERSRRRLIDSLRARMDAPEPVAEHPKVSVIVCTHRRSRYLADFVESVGRLDPAPFEVIVVDNDPGEMDSRAFVEGAGLRYLREDRRGLDNGRNAGLRAARGEIVVFTDDDCVLSPGWLRPLGRAFGHEAVSAVTGPVFPYRLDTPARVRMERQASLGRGMRRVAFDWQTISPVHGSAVGVGANMAFRRSRLLELGDEPFPPELDAGTETESGGDSYVLGRLLAAGGRILYDPELFIFHQHRPDGAALNRAVRGYGIGLSAMLTKLLVEERELAAPRAWSWLVKQYLKTQRRRVVGRADAVETRISWNYLYGGFLGVGRWVRALRTQRQALAGQNGRSGRVELAAASELPVPAAPVSAPDPAAGDPLLSVVVPTFRRPQALEKCLRALGRQDAPAGSFEVVVVDDDPDSDEPPQVDHHPFRVRSFKSGGVGAAGARNRAAAAAAGRLLLFLDDDVIPDPRLVGRHLAWHEAGGEKGVLVGPCRPRPVSDSLIARAAGLWWQDFFHLLGESTEPTFVKALTGNVSVGRDLFEELGGFSEAATQMRREDWEWGLRLRRRGIRIDFDPKASARHEFSLEAADRLRAARLEAVGDTTIVKRYPEAFESLPLSAMRPATPRRPLRWVGLRLWRHGAVQRAVLTLLALLEAAKLRELWQRLFVHAQAASYAEGAREGGWRHRSGPRAPAPDLPRLELASDERIEPPPVAARPLRVTLRGKPVTEVFPREGIWAPALAEQVVDWMHPQTVMRAAAPQDWPDGGEPHGLERAVEVVFGPAAEPGDSAYRAELEHRGAVVRVAEGSADRHWEAVLAAAAEGSRELVAFPLPGTSPRAAWLGDALSAFEGERVALTFGGALGRRKHPEALYLHDRDSADSSLALVGYSPAYLVVRRSILNEVSAEGNLLAPLIRALDTALGTGRVIGHRHCRGLTEPAYPETELGKAFGGIEASRLSRGDQGGPAALVGRSVQGLLVLAWATLKRSGILQSRERSLAAGIVSGSVSELRMVRRAGYLDRPAAPRGAEDRL
jgi:GT2 family glycosyltransferase